MTDKPSEPPPQLIKVPVANTQLTPDQIANAKGKLGELLRQAAAAKAEAEKKESK